MCGITGIFSKYNLDKIHIIGMNDCLRHRGPDDEGFLAVSTNEKRVYPLSGKESVIKENRIESFEKNTNMFLGHRRLSIIDLSVNGHQPMTNEDGSLYIIFNGEIYNYIEIKSELLSLGYKFFSDTDTEVLLKSYAQWGEKCLDKFNGMWSFVIYDVKKNILFGSRDRFGVKPFYYFLNNDYFAFASEIKALVRLPFCKKEINVQAVFDYLALGFIENEEEGFFKGIFELQPSEYFTFDLNTYIFRKKKYYELKYKNNWTKYNSVDAVKFIDEVKEKIFNAVRLRLRSDVPVGSCLSGGIDSSSVVCVINDFLKRESIKQIGEYQKIFTASYPDSGIDEKNWAEIVAKNTNTEWNITYPNSNDLLNDLENLVKIQDIPFGSTSIYSQYRVMKIARENNIKVLLDGQGADELFTGYTYFFRPFYNEIIRNFSVSCFINEFKGVKNSPVNSNEIFITLLKSIIKKFFPLFLKEKILRLKFKENDLIKNDFWFGFKDRYLNIKGKEFTNLNDSLFDQFTKSSLKNLLKYEDRNSMNFSIESRTPFSDDINLIEYVFNIPSAYKIHNGWTKYLLRESMKDVIPDKIRNRTDKIGFATPEYYWLNDIKNNLKDYITDDLNDYIKTDNLLKNWDSYFLSQTKIGITYIWRFINFAVWKKVFNL
jgi:asparagine synthase (glutamine-hydrolysing)